MRPDTLLYRQVHPDWHRDGRFTSLMFQPSREEGEDHQVSVDDGDQISAEDSYKYHRCNDYPDSIGVMAVTPEECKVHNVTVTPDSKPGHESHTLLKFHPNLGKRRIRRIAQFLTAYATKRGWRYGPIEPCGNGQGV